MKQRFITRSAYRHLVTAKVYEEKPDGDEVHDIEETLVLPKQIDTSLMKEVDMLKRIISEKHGVIVLMVSVTGVLPIKLRVSFEDFVAAAVKYEREKEASKDAAVYEDDMEG